MQFHSIEEIIEDIAAGKMVIIVDDESRENEGDFLMAASKVRPEDINFMATHGRGLICMTMRQERCKQLNLPLMVSTTHSQHETNFTVSIEAAEGVTTGISAYDRALTVRAAVAPDATPESIIQPGHIFPLMAQPGGVLNRAGHTEAGCDLAELAQLEPASVIVEIMNDDGTMARRDDLFKIAEKYDLKIATIEDLIEYRLKNSRTVECVDSFTMNNAFGAWQVKLFADEASQQTHMAMYKGDIDADTACLVRVHIFDALNDAFHFDQTQQGLPLQKAMQVVAEEEQGVIVVLNPKNTRDFAKGFKADDSTADNVKANDGSKGVEDIKTYGIGAQILVELGVHKMRVLSSPKKFHGIAGFGLEVVDYYYD